MVRLASGEATVTETEIFAVPAFDDRAAINTLTPAAVGSQTKLLARSRFPSVEDLEGALSTGMGGARSRPTTA